VATLDVNVPVMRHFMDERGWSERELASHMDLAYSYVNRVLGGKRRPGAKFIAGTLLLGLTLEEAFTLLK
jgi:transcriptional regulator with XRE-family HTH domain